MKVLVTGAGGMLADAVGVSMAKAQDEVFGLFYSAEEELRFKDRFGQKSVQKFGSALTNYADLESLLAATKEFSPDWIVHCAAWTDVDGCEIEKKRAWESNAMAALQIALVARERKARLLFLSTDYVFDGFSRVPYTESDPPHPLSQYGNSKLGGERFVQLVTDEHLIVRTSWLFGPGGKNFVDTISDRLNRGENVSVVNDQRGCPTYTADLVEALHDLMIRNVRGLFHVASGDGASWYELALAIAEHFGRTDLVTPTTTAALNRPAPRPAYSMLDCTKYATATGRALPQWRDALKRYLRSRPDATA